MIQLQNKGYIQIKYGKGKQHCAIRWLASIELWKTASQLKARRAWSHISDPTNYYIRSPNSVSHFSCTFFWISVVLKLTT